MYINFGNDLRFFVVVFTFRLWDVLRYKVSDNVVVQAGDMQDVGR